MQQEILFGLHAVFLQEAVNPSFRIHKLLLTCEKGMAGRANFRLNNSIRRLARRTGFVLSPTTTNNRGLFVLWMDVLLRHGVFTP